MKTTILKTISMAAAFAVSLVAGGEVVTAVKSGTEGYNWGPNNPEMWSDGKAPSPQNDYVVPHGKLLSTGKNNTETIVFEGKSLTVGGENEQGKILFCGAGVTEFPCGIKIYDAGSGSNVMMGNSGNQNTEVHRIRGPVTLYSTYKSAPQLASAFRSNGQHLYFEGKIVGDVNTGMNFEANEWSNVNTNNLIAFTGDMSEYYGYVNIRGVNTLLNSLVLGLGNITFSGTVKLASGEASFFRTVETDDIAKVANLEMSANSTLFPQVDVVNGKCGTIEVTQKFTRTGKQRVHAKFLNSFSSCDHGKISFPVLKVAQTAGTLSANDFELSYEDAGEVPEGAISLNVANDENGTPTLYLEIAAYSVVGVTDVVLSTSDGSQESAFLEAYSSHWSPVGVPEEGRKYHVKNGKELHTPYVVAAGGSNSAPLGDDIDFTGDAIVLGDASSVGTLALWSMASVNVPSIVLSNAVVSLPGNWAGLRKVKLNSDIFVAASDPSKAVFKTVATWQHLYLEGTFSGDENSAVRFLFTNANSDMNLDSDCSNYKGVIEVSATSANGANLADFRIGAAKIGGTLKLGEVTGNEGGKMKFTATNALEVDKLVVNRPTAIGITVNTATYEAQSDAVKVLTSFEANAPVTIDTVFTGGDPIGNNFNEAFIPVMKWPVSLNVDESKFSAGTFSVSGVAAASQFTPSSGFMSVSFRTEGDWRILGLEKPKTIYLLNPDDSKISDDPVMNSARASFDECYKEEADHLYGWNWSDGQRPSSAFDYYVNKTLRTNSSKKDQFFLGKTMHLSGGTLVMQSTTATISNMTVAGGNLSHIHQGGDTKAYDFARGGTRRMYGNAFVSAKGVTVTAPFLTAAVGSGCFDFAMNLSGPGQVNFKMNSSNLFPQETVNPSYLMVSGDNSAWTGNLLCCAADAARWSSDEHLVVLFSGMDNLGGDPSAFAHNGLTLRHAATLKPMASTAYSRANRGIMVDGFGGIDCDTNIVFNIDSAVTYFGKLRKQGAGSVLFGGAAKFLQLDSKPGDVPLQGVDSNLLHVVEGSVGVTSSEALNGVKIVFEDGAALRVKAGGADSNLAAKGLVNVKTETPMVANSANGKIVVEFDTDGLEANGSAYRAAICTVTGGAAERLRGKFVLRRPKSMEGYGASMAEEIVNAADGTVTFVADIRYVSMTVIIR